MKTTVIAHLFRAKKSYPKILISLIFLVLYTRKISGMTPELSPDFVTAGLTEIFFVLHTAFSCIEAWLLVSNPGD